MENKNQQLKEWVAQYSEELFRWAWYKTSSKETAEDLVQETFIAAYQSWDKFNHESAPKTWLYAILKNKVVDHFRKKAHDIIVPESGLLPENDADTYFDSFFDEKGSWKKEARPKPWNFEEEHLLDNMVFRQVLYDCLKKLPASWNSVVRLKYLEEKKGDEICKEIAISPTNLWQILYRARLQLRACIEKNWFKK